MCICGEIKKALGSEFLFLEPAAVNPAVGLLV
jgi:hypothetical protein